MELEATPGSSQPHPSLHSMFFLEKKTQFPPGITPHTSPRAQGSQFTPVWPSLFPVYPPGMELDVDPEVALAPNSWFSLEKSSNSHLELLPQTPPVPQNPSSAQFGPVYPSLFPVDPTGMELEATPGSSQPHPSLHSMFFLGKKTQFPTGITPPHLPQCLWIPVQPSLPQFGPVYSQFIPLGWSWKQLQARPSPIPASIPCFSLEKKPLNSHLELPPTPPPEPQDAGSSQFGPVQPSLAQFIPSLSHWDGAGSDSGLVPAPSQPPFHVFPWKKTPIPTWNYPPHLPQSPWIPVQPSLAQFVPVCPTGMELEATPGSSQPHPSLHSMFFLVHSMFFLGKPPQFPPGITPHTSPEPQDPSLPQFSPVWPSLSQFIPIFPTGMELEATPGSSQPHPSLHSMFFLEKKPPIPTWNHPPHLPHCPWIPVYPSLSQFIPSLSPQDGAGSDSGLVPAPSQPPFHVFPWKTPPIPTWNHPLTLLSAPGSQFTPV
ncbi:uncharacterized protein LOC126652304 [Myiozetetes cayanensis]|uniref:uncharacterized protein LOC126652304 n=1 Tax=Myiozetetes cayanensis TaxID=478635 RepID=UPI00215F81F9|nr:uncharacterized protein LOC126652304 [Myiozetetes cayanensis]